MVEGYRFDDRRRQAPKTEQIAADVRMVETKRFAFLDEPFDAFGLRLPADLFVLVRIIARQHEFAHVVEEACDHGILHDLAAHAFALGDGLGCAGRA